MSGEKETGVGLKWPICTMLIVAAISALIYYGYTKFEAEQAIMAERAASSPPAKPPSGQAPGRPTAAGCRFIFSSVSR